MNGTKKMTNTIDILLPKNGRPLFKGVKLLEKISFNNKYGKKDENIIIKKDYIQANILGLKCLSIYFKELDIKGLNINKEDFEILKNLPLFINEKFVQYWEKDCPWNDFRIDKTIINKYADLLNSNKPSNAYDSNNNLCNIVWEYYVINSNIEDIVDIIDTSVAYLNKYLNDRPTNNISAFENNILNLIDSFKLNKIDSKVLYWLSVLLGTEDENVKKTLMLIIKKHNYNSNVFFNIIEDTLNLDSGIILSRLKKESPLIKFNIFKPCLDNNQDFNFIDTSNEWKNIWDKLTTDVFRNNIRIDHKMNDLSMIDNIILKNKEGFIPINKWEYLNGMIEIWKSNMINSKTKILFYGEKGTGKRSLSLSLLNTIKLNIYELPEKEYTIDMLELGLNTVECLNDSAIILTNNIETLNKIKNFNDNNVNIIWNVEKISDISKDILEEFDYIYDLSNIPFENRLEYANELFEDKNLAIKISQQLKTFAGIYKASTLVKSDKDWKTIYPHVNIEKPKENDFFKVLDYSAFKSIPEMSGYNDLDDSFKEILDIFENPYKYEKNNIKVPKGFILEGHPGTGKTLFVKQIAKKIQLPLIVANTNHLVENVNEICNLFDFARASSPCILFFDEIDMLLNNPDEGLRKDTRKQMVLNTMLSEIDGVKSLAGVTIVGTTNNMSSISLAAIRSGRLSKIIKLNIPDFKSRKEIWMSYLLNKEKEHIDIDHIAKISSGFTGADIAEAVNEAALNAAYNNESINLSYIINSCETIMFGRPNGIYITEESKIKTAVHEVGHAIIAMHYDKEVNRVTIVPRQSALGVTSIIEEEGHHNLSISDMNINISILLAGIAAEKVIFEDYESGGSSDLKRSFELVSDCFLMYGFNEKIGKVFDPDRKNWSENKKLTFETEVKEYIDKKFEDVISILKNYKELIDDFSKDLIKHKSLSIEDLKIWKNKMTK